jgi:hypothetical protein
MVKQRKWGPVWLRGEIRIAVGTYIAMRPPHKTVRAAFPLPPWVFDGEALIRPRMLDARVSLSQSRRPLHHVPQFPVPQFPGLAPKPSIHNRRQGQSCLWLRAPLSASVDHGPSLWGEIFKQRAAIDEPKKPTVSIDHRNEIPVSANNCVH